MRVAYLTGRYPAISHTFIMREVKALRDLGIDVDTFSIWRTDKSQLLTAEDEDEHENTYAVLGPPLGDVLTALALAATRPVRLAGTLRRSWQLRRPGARGFVLAFMWWVEALVLWRQCRLRDIRHVHVHLNGTAPTVALLLTAFADDSATGGDVWTWSMTVHGPSEFYDTLGERLAEKTRSAAFVVCISDFARSQLMGLVEERHWPKLRVVHCGVDPLTFRPVARESEGALRVLNVGRLVPVKAQAVLVDAVARLRRRGVDVLLTIIGEGPTRGELEELIYANALGDSVELVGAVGQDSILDHYQRCNVFCLTSVAEGVPVVLMEAMAQEIPVVAPAIMGIPELVEDGISGILTRPARAAEVADALARLASDTWLRERLGRRGRAKVEREFTIELSAAKLREIFIEHLATGEGLPRLRVVA